MKSRQEKSPSMYGVFEITSKGEKPCSTVGYPELKGKGWDNHVFPTFEQAKEYVREWLDVYYSEPDGGLVLDEPWNYSGYGDKIVIRRLK